MSPGEYEAWYQTARGSWIADHEFDLLTRLLDSQAGATLLDVGCGTGHFSRALSLPDCGQDEKIFDPE
jgi:2-polyprenyl-3-methyl-5-hydroxy-6-metoxy-1,4-benzoquinol methylase